MISVGAFYIIIIAIKSYEVFSITTRIEQSHPPVRTFRRHVDPLPPADWELGLREAVHQALLRDHHTNPSLRDHLLTAPLIGRQNNASPFGDVAVLARGQLYDTPHGFKLVQDPNDCGDCHHNRCLRPECQTWKNSHHEKLLALWTVKRIRHRDPHYGHVFELEYTISPITSAINEQVVSRGGFFNYNVPGHIFVIKSDSRLNTAYYLNNNADKHLQLTVDKWQASRNHQQPHGDSNYYNEKGNVKPGILIGVTPEGHKQVLHSFPGLYSSYHPQTTQHGQTTIDPKEYELYKKLIESLASKTTSNGPHRFSTIPQVTTSQLATTKPTYQQQPPTFIPITQTTFVRFPDTSYVPLTDNALTTTTAEYQPALHVITPIHYPTTTSQKTTYTPHFAPSLKPPQPITVPVTTIHYYAPKEEEITSTQPQQTTKSTVQKHKPTTSPTTLSDNDDYDLFPETESTRSMTTTTKRLTKPTKTTLTQTPEEEEEVSLDLFSINLPTQPMKPITQLPDKDHPDSINEQLPPPDKDTDTTIPYTSSTVTQPSTSKSTTTTTPSLEITTSTDLTTQSVSVTELIPPITVQHKPITTTQFIPSRTTYFLPSSETDTTTQQFVSTTRKPTTIVGYSFDSTTKGNVETTQQISEFPTTHDYTKEDATTTYKMPTTVQYYYSFDSKQPQTTTVTYFTPSTEEEQTTIRKYKKTKPPKTTATNDFLSDPSNNYLTTQAKRDFDADDIFGKAPTIGTTESTTTTKLETTQSDLAEALFGGRRAKQIKVSSKLIPTTTTTNTPKVIYSNFYTIAPEKTATALLLEDTTNTAEATTSTDFKPSTDQSYSTSISFKVHKRKHNTENSTELFFEPTLMADLTEVVNHKGDYKVYKAELPASENTLVSSTTTEGSKSETKKVFDDFALQLVNHARSIDYLSSKKISRQAKYRRKSYVPKSRRSQRRSTISKN